MLTLDLIETRVYRGEVRPRYLDSSSEQLLALAAQLIEIFETHRGRARGELTATLAALVGSGTNYRFHRALAKLLLDRSTFEVKGAVEPTLAREALFSAAARAYAPRNGEVVPAEGDFKWRFEREATLRTAAEELGISVDELERSLYADLKNEQRLIEFRTCRPQWLLCRYNVGLAQGVLLRATELVIEVAEGDPRRLRELVRKIKFFRLLHRLERTESGYRIDLDGPLSLFKASGRYGLQMALFLPALLHLENWSLAAAVRWGRPPRARTFSLGPSQGLEPITAARGQWRPPEMSIFCERFAALRSAWEIIDEPELIDLGGGALVVSDFSFRHRDGGDPVALEVLGFWRRGTVAGRLEQIRRTETRRVLIAVGRGLAAGEAELENDQDPRLIIFRRTLLPKKVLAALERLPAEA